MSACIYIKGENVILIFKRSCVTIVLFGVMQDSVLGPVLFVIFINDVSCGIVQAQIKLLADDVNLYSSVNAFNCGDLQQSLDLLSSWAKTWQLNINRGKCSVLSIQINKNLLFLIHISLTDHNSLTRLLLLILVYWLVHV